MSSGHRLPTILAVSALALTWGGPTASAASVRIERVPNAGYQPHAVAGTDGSIHLVYLAGDPKGSDVFYVQRAAGASDWSAPLKVNTQPGSAIGVGTIRGAQLAIGKGGRVHVVWNGSDKARPRPQPESLGAPLMYARLGNDGKSFLPELNLINKVEHLDGGGAVAADEQGNVFVIWHGHPVGAPEGEENRAVFLAKSGDQGASFDAERRISPPDAGACGCCGLAAFGDRAGNIYAVFRAAREKENRDSLLLVSRDHGETFQSENLQPWRATQCPMSLPSISEGGGKVWVAWETGSQVHFSAVGQREKAAPMGRGSRKHPVTAVNERGESLLAWSEGTGWQKGGAVEWQLFDAEGRPAGAIGHADGLPVWGLPAAVALKDGNFLILF